jgi:fluoride exporter
VPEHSQPKAVVDEAPGVSGAAARRRGATRARPRRALVHSRWDIVGVIAVGGALGSLARGGVGQLLPWSGEAFPWATFVVNLSGGLALGVLMVFLLDVWPPHRFLRPFLGVGLLGGYTTFSTYMLETRELLDRGQPATAVGYLVGSLVAGLAAVWLGIAATRLLLQRRHPRDRPSQKTNAGAEPVRDRLTDDRKDNS